MTSDAAPVRRLPPTTATLRALYLVAGNQCAFPDCRAALIDEAGGWIGEVCHIEAALPGGERFNPAMTEEGRRAPANLVLLCHPHHVATNDVVVWTVTRLRQVKARHEGRFRMGLRGLEQSAGPQAMTPLVEAAHRLAVAAVRLRREPAAVVAAWVLSRQQLSRQSVGFDDMGERVFLRPSRSQERAAAQQLKDVLDTVVAQLAPLHEAVHVLGRVAMSTSPDDSAHCEWLLTAADDLMGAAGTWADVDVSDDGGGFPAAVHGVRAAADAVTALARGEEAPPVPERQPDPAAASARDAFDRLDDHRRLLERARPHARVGVRAYDPQLRADLVTACRFAAGLPGGLISFLSCDLDATAGLAWDVAKNATADERAALLDRDGSEEPAFVAVALIRAWASCAPADEALEAAAEAKARLVTLLEGTDWAALMMLPDGLVDWRPTFGVLSFAASPERVAEVLGKALDADPALLPVLLRVCAVWSEEVEERGNVWLTFRAPLPAWLPVASLRRHVASQFADVRAAAHSRTPAEHTDHGALASALLWAADSTIV